MSIQAVFFDMGGTIETFRYTRQLRLEATPGLQRILLNAGIDLHLNSEQLYTLVIQGLAGYHQWRMKTMEELPPHKVWCEYILAGYPIDTIDLEAIAEDLMFYIETRYYQRQMRPEIPAVLESIRQMGLKIGLISNVCSRSQVPHNLEKYGIRDFFYPVVLSSEYGRRKPDPAIYHFAARLANVPTSKCVYVGDRIARDIQGAHRAGYCLAIQIYHAFKHNEQDDGDTPDAVIDNMTELVGILKEPGRRIRAYPDPIKSKNDPGVKAFLFDAEDVLYYRPNKGRKIIEFLAELKLDPAKISPSEKINLQTRAFCGQIDQNQYRQELLKLSGLTRPEDIKRGLDIMEKEDNDVLFFEGARETLFALKEQGCLLGIVTDTSRPIHEKLGWLEQAGFGNVWDSIISSVEIGVRKPDPKIYQAALHQLGCAPKQAAFVGHKKSELDGAKAVGITTIAFNYQQAAKADYYIERFADLLNLPLLTWIEEKER